MVAVHCDLASFMGWAGHTNVGLVMSRSCAEHCMVIFVNGRVCDEVLVAPCERVGVTGNRNGGLVTVVIHSWHVLVVVWDICLTCYVSAQSKSGDWTSQLRLFVSRMVNGQLIIVLVRPSLAVNGSMTVRPVVVVISPQLSLTENVKSGRDVSLAI
jgi:hypothetical protein